MNHSSFEGYGMIEHQHSNHCMSQVVSYNNMVWSARQVAKDPTADMVGQKNKY